MKMKNQILKYFFSLISGLLSFTAVYLSGSFANASFDITEWNSDGRGFIAFFGFFAFGLGIIFSLMLHDLAKNDK